MEGIIRFGAAATHNSIYASCDLRKLSGMESFLYVFYIDPSLCTVIIFMFLLFSPIFSAYFPLMFLFYLFKKIYESFNYF